MSESAIKMISSIRKVFMARERMTRSTLLLTDPSGGQWYGEGPNRLFDVAEAAGAALL
jgi:hypothetical protein